VGRGGKGRREGREAGEKREGRGGDRRVGEEGRGRGEVRPWGNCAIAAGGIDAPGRTLLKVASSCKLSLLLACTHC